jgi:hypothetical protein
MKMEMAAMGGPLLHNFGTTTCFMLLKLYLYRGFDWCFRINVSTNTTKIAKCKAPSNCKAKRCMVEGATWPHWHAKGWLVHGQSTNCSLKVQVHACASFPPGINFLGSKSDIVTAGPHRNFSPIPAQAASCPLPRPAGAKAVIQVGHRGFNCSISDPSFSSQNI